MTYRTEFPDFPPESMPAIPAAWEDASWRNDACPAFTHGALRIWVDYADPAARELPGCRYGVTIDPDMFAGVDRAYPDMMTDEWSHVLAFVDALSGDDSHMSGAVRAMAESIRLEEGKADKPCPDLLAMARRHLDLVSGAHAAVRDMVEALCEMAPLLPVEAPDLFGGFTLGAAVEYQNGQLATVLAIGPDGYAVLHTPGDEDGAFTPAHSYPLGDGEPWSLSFIADNERGVATLADALAICRAHAATHGEA